MLSKIEKVINDHLNNTNAKGFYIKSRNATIDVRGPKANRWSVQLWQGKSFESYETSKEMLLGRVGKLFAAERFNALEIELY